MSPARRSRPHLSVDSLAFALASSSTPHHMLADPPPIIRRTVAGDGVGVSWVVGWGAGWGVYWGEAPAW